MSALSEIRSRAEAAAAGPWRIERRDLSLWVLSEDQMLEANLGYVGNRPERNAEFIAHSRTDIVLLVNALDAVERTAKYLDTLADGDKHYAKLFRDAVATALAGKS